MWYRIQCIINQQFQTSCRTEVYFSSFNDHIVSLSQVLILKSLFQYLYQAPITFWDCRSDWLKLWGTLPAGVDVAMGTVTDCNGCLGTGVQDMSTRFSLCSCRHSSTLQIANKGWDPLWRFQFLFPPYPKRSQSATSNHGVAPPRVSMSSLIVRVVCDVTRNCGDTFQMTQKSFAMLVLLFSDIFMVILKQDFLLCSVYQVSNSQDGDFVVVVVGIQLYLILQTSMHVTLWRAIC